MKKSRYTDSQILSILKQNESGVLVTDLCREHGMSNAAFYAPQGGTEVNGVLSLAEWMPSLMKRMKALEDDVHDALISRAHGCAGAMRTDDLKRCMLKKSLRLRLLKRRLKKSGEAISPT